MDLIFKQEKPFENPLHGLQIIAILAIQENSGVFLNHPVATTSIWRQLSTMLSSIGEVINIFGQCEPN